VPYLPRRGAGTKERQEEGANSRGRGQGHADPPGRGRRARRQWRSKRQSVPCAGCPAAQVFQAPRKRHPAQPRHQRGPGHARRGCGCADPRRRREVEDSRGHATWQDLPLARKGCAAPAPQRTRRSIGDRQRGGAHQVEQGATRVVREAGRVAWRHGQAAGEGFHRLAE